MKLLLSLFFGFTMLMAYGQNRSIQFQTLTLAEAMEKAKTENKLIFMDAYTTWCGPCKWMARNMFTRDEIADYYNKNFINVKFDMEKGEGLEIAKRYQVRCYPNLLFIDGNGKLVHRQAGAAEEVADYITMGEKAKDPERRFSALMDAYQGGKRDAIFMTQFIDAMAGTCLPYDDYVKAYFETQPESALTNAANWRMLFYHQQDIKSREFMYLLQHQDDFVRLYGADSVQMKISATFRDGAGRMMYAEDFKEADLEKFKSEIKAMNFKGSDAVLFHVQLTYLQKGGDIDKVLDYAFENGENYFQGEEINSFCWTAYEKTDKAAHLAKAEAWMAKLTSKPEGHNYAYLDTYAAVLYKLKKKEAAKKAALEAIAMAKSENMAAEEYAATEDLLRKIEKLK